MVHCTLGVRAWTLSLSCLIGEASPPSIPFILNVNLSAFQSTLNFCIVRGDNAQQGL